MDKEKIDEIYRLGEIVKFPSGYAVSPKKYGTKSWKKEAGTKPPHWTI